MTTITETDNTAKTQDTDAFGPSTITDEVILDVRDLHTEFTTKWGTVKAVDGVSYSLRRGETLGIVGESGSGKSVTALSIMRLVPSPPGKIVSGEVILAGEDILKLSESEMTLVRGGKISMILQDPLTALNPVFTIRNQVGEAISLHQKLSRGKVAEKVIEALKKVRIPAPERRAKDYPHQLSGGMRQRVVGAIGISSGPDVIIADEPTTSLDVTIQAAYLRLLKQIQAEEGVGIVFITHDFGIVAKMCDRVGCYVRRQNCGDRRRKADIQHASPSLHKGTYRIGSQIRRKGGEVTPNRRTAAAALQPAGRLPFCSALRKCSR